MNKRTKILSVGAAAAALLVVLVALSIAAPVGSNKIDPVTNRPDQHAQSSRGQRNPP